MKKILFQFLFFGAVLFFKSFSPRQIVRLGIVRATILLATILTGKNVPMILLCTGILCNSYPKMCNKLTKECAKKAQQRAVSEAYIKKREKISNFPAMIFSFEK